MSRQQASWTVPADHPAFAGHFPGQPIVPGVVLLDRLLLFLGPVAHGYSIPNAKFLSPAGPGERLDFAWEIKENGAIQFSITAADRVVARGAVSPAPRS